VAIWRARHPGPTVLAEWDRVVRSTPGTEVTQLSAWALLRAKAGYIPSTCWLISAVESWAEPWSCVGN
jgi:hypothetical protein